MFRDVSVDVLLLTEPIPGFLFTGKNDPINPAFPFLGMEVEVPPGGYKVLGEIPYILEKEEGSEASKQKLLMVSTIAETEDDPVLLFYILSEDLKEKGGLY